jgi:hypothetical protein
VTSGRRPAQLIARFPIHIEMLQTARGETGVQAKPGPGLPCKLTATDKRRLQAMLLKGDQAAWFETELWT